MRARASFSSPWHGWEREREILPGRQMEAAAGQMAIVIYYPGRCSVRARADSPSRAVIKQCLGGCNYFKNQSVLYTPPVCVCVRVCQSNERAPISNVYTRERELSMESYLYLRENEMILARAAGRAFVLFRFITGRPVLAPNMISRWLIEELLCCPAVRGCGGLYGLGEIHHVAPRASV